MIRLTKKISNAYACNISSETSAEHSTALSEARDVPEEGLIMDCYLLRG